jgi:hypothetical protein
MRRFIVVLTAAALLAPGAARAQHTGDMLVAATAPGGGALALDFNPDTVVRVSYDPVLSGLLGQSAYTASDPGFDALETAEPPDLYPVDTGTEVTVEVTAIDSGKVAAVLNAVTLDSVGDSVVLGTAGVDLHHHPTFQLLLTLPPGEFGEGRLSLNIRQSGGPATYADSETLTLVLSNGHLAPPDYDAASYDGQSVACQKALGKGGKKVAAVVYAQLTKCLDAVAIHAAREASGHPGAATAAAAARSKCGDAEGTLLTSQTMLGKIGAALATAFDLVRTKCGPAPGSEDYDDEAIRAHLGLVSCRIQNALAGAYHGAHEALEAITQAGTPVIDALPCLVPTSEAD